MGAMDMFPNVTPPLLIVAFVESQHATNNITQINENILYVTLATCLIIFLGTHSN
jgi:hypothetical protein